MRPLVIAFSLLPAIANAQLVTGNQIIKICEDYSAIAFASGVLDTVLVSEENVSKKTICLPDQVTSGQARDVMCTYIRENPSRQHQLAASMAWVAFEQAWPCPN
jgi:hypothetical protein